MKSRKADTRDDKSNVKVKFGGCFILFAAEVPLFLGMCLHSECYGTCVHRPDCGRAVDKLRAHADLLHLKVFLDGYANAFLRHCESYLIFVFAFPQAAP